MCCLELVSLEGEKHFKPRPQNRTFSWYLLGVFFKLSEEHPRSFYMGVAPGSLLIRSINYPEDTSEIQPVKFLSEELCLCLCLCQSVSISVSTRVFLAAEYTKNKIQARSVS